ncbi:MAG: cobalamin-binding protein, partial [Clostridiales bacterium]|nr:cobalamin-binding protein [Clostridiales bacterium]
NPDCKIVGASALLTTTMDSLRNTVQSLINAGCKNQVKIMVGGAPITQAFADEIGADAYTPDAGAAAVKAVELVS